MEITKKKIEVTVYGVVYQLSAPKALESAEYVDSIGSDQKLTNSQMIVKTQSFLVSMGLPKDVCEDLELDNLNEVIEFITEKK